MFNTEESFYIDFIYFIFFFFTKMATNDVKIDLCWESEKKTNVYTVLVTVIGSHEIAVHNAEYFLKKKKKKRI